MKVNVENLKVAMAKKCINAVELSKKANVSRGTITNLLGNKTDLSPKTVGLIAKALEVDVTEIIIDEAAATANDENK